ncbi:MAG: hypothetical protein QOF21_1593 [Actinomycetota bacterium]
MTPGREIQVTPWNGQWADDDRDANFKSDVVLYAQADPLATLDALGAALDIPVGGLVHYVLARWASAGSAALLEVGPSMINRMWEQIENAELAATDEAKLAAYDALKQMLSWLRLPLADES